MTLPADIEGLIRTLASEDWEDDARRFLSDAEDALGSLRTNQSATTRRLAALLTEAADLIRRRYYPPAETPAVTARVSGRLCACGCRQPVTSPRPEAKYATGACRVRHHRANR